MNEGMDKEYRKFMNTAAEEQNLDKLNDLAELVKAEKMEGGEDLLKEIEDLKKGIEGGIESASVLEDFQESEIARLREEGAESSIDFESELIRLNAESDALKEEFSSNAERLKEVVLQQFATSVHQAEDNVDAYIEKEVLNPFAHASWVGVRTLAALVERGSLDKEKYDETIEKFFESMAKDASTKINKELYEGKEDVFRKAMMDQYKDLLADFEEEAKEMLEEAKDML
jgi:hypothetical protein